MTLHDALQLSISALRGAMMRTLLTILGLGVGVGAVLTVLTLGDAGEKRVEAEIAKLGVDKVWIRAADNTHALSKQDSGELYEATGAPACAGAYTASVVRLGDTAGIAQVAGYDDAMVDVHAPKVLQGRAFTPAEFGQGRPVCLVDAALAEYFGVDVLGQWINVANRRLRVVGVIKNMTMQLMAAGQGMMILPLNTYYDTFDGQVAEITLCVQPGQRTEQVADQALAVLSSDDGFRADTLEAEITAAREIVRIFVMVLLCVAAVCMVTGGIGVMNVLLISVRERRSEIGLMKAVGATSRQLVLLYMLEAGVYAFLGGILGIVLGMIMIRLFGNWIGLDTGLEISVVLPVLAATAALGICAGVAPALKAAHMQPVDALLCE